MADRGRVGYGQATPKLSSFLIKNEFAHHYQKMAAIKNRVPFSKDSTLDNAVPHTKTLRHLQFNGKAEADRVIREKQINKSNHILMEKVAKMGHTLGDQRRGNPKTINGPTRMRMHAKIQHDNERLAMRLMNLRPTAGCNVKEWDEHRKHSDGVRKRLQAAAAAKRSFLDISGGSGDKKRKGGRGKGGRSKGRGGRGDEAEEERRDRLYHQDGGSSAAGSTVASLGYAEPEGYGRANEDSGGYQDVEAAGGVAGGATGEGGAVAAVTGGGRH